MDRGDGIRWPSNPYHVPLSYNHHQPQTDASDSTSRNSPEQAFISKIRDDAALCRLIKQRKTRWIEEEDEFASFLVKEFEHGMARDVTNSTTLRAYLSRKLICTPMRISKKYAGKKVGTILYHRKELLPEIVEISSQTHLQLEQKCLAALVVQLNRMKESEKKAAELKAKAKQNLAVQEKAVVPDPANNANDQMPMLSQDTVHQMKQQLQIKSHQHHQNSFNPSRHQVIGNQQGVSQIQHPHAFNHTAYQAGVYVRQPPMGPSVQNPTVYSHNIIKPPTGNTAEPMMHTMQYFPSNAAMPVQYNQDYSASANAEVPSKKPSSSAHFQHNRVGKASDGAARTTVNRNPTAFRSDGSMLDLVAGFDKHAASLIPKPDIIAVLESRPSSTTWPQDSHFFSTTGVEESPYITSKSFDEMHKCLGGIDIPSKPSHLDLNATSNTRPNDDEKPILSAESPYITSKSFDDMHRCLGMSHFDLRGNESPKSVKSQDNGSTESSSAYVESMPTVDINAEHRESIDPRSDKYLSAFSPFDGSRIMQDHDAPCNFDSLSQRAPLQVHQAFQTIFEPVSHTNPRYRAESQFSPSQSSTQSASMRYAAPSEYGLAKFLNKNCASAYPHAVSTGTSEQSSDRGNSSPDQSD